MSKKLSTYVELVNLLGSVKDDAELSVVKRLPNNMITYRKVCRAELTAMMMQLIVNGKKEVEQSDITNYDLIALSDDYGIDFKDIVNSVYHETVNVPDGYEEYVDKYNPYHNIYRKVDHEAKTIGFLIGEYSKTLELIEEGYSKGAYVSKPYRQKFMKCVGSKELEKHCKDEFFNPAMINIGRKVLKMEMKLQFAETV